MDDHIGHSAHRHLLRASRFALALTRQAGFRLAGLLPGGCRTLWTTAKGFRSHGHPPSCPPDATRAILATTLAARPLYPDSYRLDAPPNSVALGPPADLKYFLRMRYLNAAGTTTTAGKQLADVSLSGTIAQR